MKTISASIARTTLQKLIDETASSHEPIQITSEGASAILLSEEDWRAVQETLYLLSLPGMRETIREGLETPLDQCSEEPGW